MNLKKPVGKGAKPEATPTTAVPIIPKKTAPLTFLAIKIIVKASPKRASKVAG